jgi:hypothetical protein
MSPKSAAPFSTAARQIDSALVLLLALRLTGGLRI